MMREEIVEPNDRDDAMDTDPELMQQLLAPGLHLEGEKDGPRLQGEHWAPPRWPLLMLSSSSSS